MKHLSLIGTALFALFGLFQTVQAVPDAGSIGIVTLIQGQVFARSSQAWGSERQLTRGASIYEGDTIETIGEGAVVLNFADGTQWDIFDGSSLTIQEYIFTDNDYSAIFQVHRGHFTYTSNELGQHSPSIVIKQGHLEIYPQEEAIIDFLRFLGVTVGKVRYGDIRYGETRAANTTYSISSKNLQSSINEGQLFVVDAEKNITRVKTQNQAIRLVKMALRVSVGKQSAGIVGRPVGKQSAGIVGTPVGKLELIIRSW